MARKPNFKTAVSKGFNPAAKNGIDSPNKKLAGPVGAASKAKKGRTAHDPKGDIDVFPNVKKVNVVNYRKKK